MEAYAVWWNGDRANRFRGLLCVPPHATMEPPREAAPSASSPTRSELRCAVVAYLESLGEGTATIREIARAVYRVEPHARSVSWAVARCVRVGEIDVVDRHRWPRRYRARRTA